MSEQCKTITLFYSKLSIKLVIYLSQYKPRSVSVCFTLCCVDIYGESLNYPFFPFLLYFFIFNDYIRNRKLFSKRKWTQWTYFVLLPLMILHLSLYPHLHCWHIHFPLLFSVSAIMIIFFKQMEVIQVVFIVYIHEWVSKFHLHTL